MKRPILSLAAAALSVAAIAQAPAFPGAEGHGRYVTGGRGGTVYHVTNLNDSGEGSLRWALSKSGTRTIVFDVSGTIELKSNLGISQGNVTVLGQTAPGEGITIAYYTVEPKASNIILRFLRFRRSQVKDVNDGADALFGRNRKNIMIDHCSFSWSIDEVCSCYDNANFSLQWCTIAEGLANPGHSKGQHSYGGIWGGKGASFHHNFIAHVDNRAPRFNGARYQWVGIKDIYTDPTPFPTVTDWVKNGKQGTNTLQAERVDFRNCVVYNWGGGGCYGGPGGGYINMVNNYFKAGPGTKNKTRVTTVTVGASGNTTPEVLYGYSSRYFINGNYVTAASEPENYDWKGVVYDGGLVVQGGEYYIKDANHYYGEDQEYINYNGTDCIRLRLDNEIDPGDVTTHAAPAAYESILAYSGASLFRDAVDVRYMEEARTGTVTYNGDVPLPGKTAKSGIKGIVDWVNDPASETQNPGVPSFPVIKEESRPEGFDTDGDGIPDVWEKANGLDPEDPEDGNLYTIDSRGWYTNLEVYANAIVEHIIKGGNANAGDMLDEYYPEYVAAGISDIVADNNSEVVRIEYFNLSGVQVAEPENGIYIRRITFADGRMEADKVMKR